MDKQVIKTIIGEKQAGLKGLRLILRGEHFDSDSNYVLVGIRRAGKSYTIYQQILQKMPLPTSAKWEDSQKS